MVPVVYLLSSTSLQAGNVDQAFFFKTLQTIHTSFIFRSDIKTINYLQAGMVEKS